jgi:para-nitrobenzyl esterase
VRCFTLASVLAGLVATASASFAVDLPVTGGTLRGEARADGSIVFQSVPYAAPPVGENRWRAPQPVVPWSGVRDATVPSTPCIQHEEGWNHDSALRGKEDCLYLTVHAPKLEPGKKYPVFFWIHGGSNRAGSGAEAADSTLYTQGIVEVSVGYRLGVFGFLSHPELTAESADHASGNYAIMDMIAALKWVKANIATFGGDPGNVIIGGQSAGSVDVGTLLFSPVARGLFTKAVMESGPAALSLPPRTLAENEQLGVQFARLANADGIKALRAMPADAVLAQGERLTPPVKAAGVLWGQQTMDGYVLRKAPLDILAKGEEAHVPLIIGDVTREFPFEGAPQQQRELIKGLYGAKAEEALRLYGFKGDVPPPDDPVLGNVGTQALADVIMRCPAGRLASLQMAAGEKVWRYQMGLPRAGLPWPPAHNAELDYVFKTPPAGATGATWPPLQRYWANFARSGDPNGGDLPQWPAMGRALTYIAFTPEGAKLRTDLRGEFCRLLVTP